jgi:hypothetical protein
MDTSQAWKRLLQIRSRSEDYVLSMKMHLQELALHNPLLIERILLILSCLMVLWLKQKAGSP